MCFGNSSLKLGMFLLKYFKVILFLNMLSQIYRCISLSNCHRCMSLSNCEWSIASLFYIMWNHSRLLGRCIKRTTRARVLDRTVLHIYFIQVLSNLFYQTFYRKIYPPIYTRAYHCFYPNHAPFPNLRPPNQQPIIIDPLWNCWEKMISDMITEKSNLIKLHSY
jgi:hypothetical protein